MATTLGTESQWCTAMTTWYIHSSAASCLFLQISLISVTKVYLKVKPRSVTCSRDNRLLIGLLNMHPPVLLRSCWSTVFSCSRQLSQKAKFTTDLFLAACWAVTATISLIRRNESAVKRLPGVLFSQKSLISNKLVHRISSTVFLIWKKLHNFL